MGIFATLHKWHLKLVGIFITCQGFMVWKLAFKMNLKIYDIAITCGNSKIHVQ
jgi:hypothetical protein